MNNDLSFGNRKVTQSYISGTQKVSTVIHRQTTMNRNIFILENPISSAISQDVFIVDVTEYLCRNVDSQSVHGMKF